MEESTRGEQRGSVQRVARRLRRWVWASSVAGILLPAATVLLKVSADDFHVWNNYKSANATLAGWIERYPALDLSQSLPFLADIAWHHTWDTRYLHVYPRIAVFNLIVLVLELLARRPILRLCEAAARWWLEAGERRARRIVATFAVVLLVSFQTRTPLGFWFPGIGGWTYRDWRPRIAAEAPAWAAEHAALGDQESAFLRRGLIPEHARYLQEDGYLVDYALFLHYADGPTLPGSYDLVDVVFPTYVFGKRFVEVRDPALFARAMQHGLRARHDGARFLLPDSVAYPNHSVYMPIDYASYPDPEGLERITTWELVVRVEAGEVELVAARERLSIDV